MSIEPRQYVWYRLRAGGWQLWDRLIGNWVPAAPEGELLAKLHVMALVPTPYVTEMIELPDVGVVQGMNTSANDGWAALGVLR